MPADEQLLNMPFPTKGINVAVEYERQPDQTTVAGQNVRTYEQLTQRARGGNRSGLLKYVPVQAGGDFLIQHLNYVVLTSGIALLTSSEETESASGTLFIPDPSTNNINFGTPPQGGFPGTTPVGGPGGPGIGPDGLPADGIGFRNPGREIRDGGSGIPNNRHAFTPRRAPLPPPPPPVMGIRFVQQANDVANVLTTGGEPTNMFGTLDYPSTVRAGDLLLVAVYDFSQVNVLSYSAPVTVTDSLGNGYIQIGDTAAWPSVMDNLDAAELSLFYAFSRSAGTCTVQARLAVSRECVNPADDGFFPGLHMTIAEYAGVVPTLPLDGVSINSGRGASNPLVTGTVGSIGGPYTVIGVFSTLGSVSPGSGFNNRTPSANVLIEDRIGVSSPLAPTANGADPDNFTGIGVAFKPL